jgi:hypothetical protein
MALWPLIVSKLEFGQKATCGGVAARPMTHGSSSSSLSSSLTSTIRQRITFSSEDFFLAARRFFGLKKSIQ